MALKRELGLLELTFYGIGIILGAGIYALVGEAAGLAGNGIWLAFGLAALVSAFTGLSYAELSSYYSKSSAEYDYVEQAFKKKMVSFIIAWLIIVSGFVSAAAVATGFANYFNSLFVSYPPLLIALVLVFLLSIFNLAGIKTSARLNILFTLIEIFGLLIIIFLSIPFMINSHVNYFDFSKGFQGVLSASALIFFAYIGFEAIAKLGEESKNPVKDLPKALVISIIITTILYVVLGAAIINVLSPEELSMTKAPMAAVAERATGSADMGLVLAVIALFSTLNTVLIMLIANSRIMYGMAEEKVLPAIFSKEHYITKAPWFAILFTMILTMIFVLPGDITFIANTSNFATFLVFAAVNASLIWLRLKKKNYNPSFKIPLNIGRFPVIAFLGLLSNLAMLSILINDYYVLLTSIILIIIGIVLFFFLEKRSK